MTANVVTKEMLDRVKTSCEYLDTAFRQLTLNFEQYKLEAEQKYDKKANRKVYISMTNESPAELYGGTWQKREGVVLLGASSAYPLGSTGGEATHTHSLNNVRACVEMTGNGEIFMKGNGGTWYASYSVATGGSGQYLSDRQVGSGAALNGALGDAGNMPPYLAVNIWTQVA